MQKIQKFQFGRIYSAPKSKTSYELISRDGHNLSFRIRKPKDSETFIIDTVSVFKADETGAFEEITLSNGSKLRSDSWCEGTKKFRRLTPRTQNNIIELMNALAA